METVVPAPGHLCIVTVHDGIFMPYLNPGWIFLTSSSAVRVVARLNDEFCKH
jgi:hypothetical protein